ncbi:hypothetical protein NW765_015497 [Fusarium oxysporum]|nr:hypothetical protein NW765_015497 [Fusarium oxysporum]
MTPYPNGSCCNRKGQCGYGEEVCGSKVCVSNCDATAACVLIATVALRMTSVELEMQTILARRALGVAPRSSRYLAADAEPSRGALATNNLPMCANGSVTASRLSKSALKGFTHLYGAFITIDLDTVAVKPWHEDDMKLYKEFTGLKKKGLETWIAIGGWTFNDSRPTRTTFSNLSASLAHRARFIKSLTSLLDEYGFQA